MLNNKAYHRLQYTNLLQQNNSAYNSYVLLNNRCLYYHYLTYLQSSFFADKRLRFFAKIKKYIQFFFKEATWKLSHFYRVMGK